MDPIQAAYFKQNAAMGARAMVQVGIRDALQQIAQQVTGLTGQIAEDFNNSLAASVSGSRDKKLKSINLEVAKLAQAKTEAAYLASRKSSATSYRFDDDGKLHRFSNKQLLRALQSDSFISATARGISFGNKTLLDETAAQWYRLNFGARPKGAKNVPVSPLVMFGQTQPGFSLKGLGPSGEFRIPYGAFASNSLSSSRGGIINTVPAGPGAAFYVFSKNFNFRPRYIFNFSRAVSRGIQGASFLEQGINVINTELPPRMEQLMLDWVHEAFTGARAGGPLGKLGHSPGSTVLQAYATSINSNLAASRVTK